MASVLPPAGLSDRNRQQFADDPRWQLIQRIIASPHLSRSSRLSGFLLFVTEETLAGRGDQLNEQRIGIHVFDRRIDYDSADDNIVRSHASRLRHRLEAYFLVEGKHETLRVELRRGSYVPSFDAVSVFPAQALSEPLENPGEPIPPSYSRTRRSGQRYLAWGLAACLLLVSAVAIFKWHNNRRLLSSSQSRPPAVRDFWSQVFVTGKRNLIVPGDSSLVLFENLTGGNVSLQNYVRRDYLSTTGDAVPEEIARRIWSRRLTSTADIELVSALLEIPEVVVTHPEIRFARDLQLADFKDANLVLIGAREADPWLSMFQPKRNFVISNDQRTRVFTVLNRSPRPGELPVYHYDPRDPQNSAYALIAFLSNLGGNGHVLIVEGTGIAGTEAASDFLSSSRRLDDLLAPALQKYGRIPTFEIMLQTKNLDGSAPQSKIVAVRFKP